MHFDNHFNTLWLSDDQRDQLIDHALQGTPDEVCGLIAGSMEHKIARAVKVIPMQNMAQDRQHHFAMDPTALSRQLTAMAHTGDMLIGIYHSHPRTASTPSPEDVANAHYPNTAYVVIGLKDAAVEVAAWKIYPHSQRVLPIRLHFGQAPPFTTETDIEPLSIRQKIAIILSAVLAVMLVLVLALSLLPPAPPIPN